MAGRAEQYRSELRELEDWDAYLKRHSGLPGPRANLELLGAVVEEADAGRLERLSRSPDEFFAACGAAGLGRIALEDESALERMHTLASDQRWRVREGVAIGLQRLGREDMPRLLKVMKGWAAEDAYVQRAVVAGLCEPALLKKRTDAVAVLRILDRITLSIASGARRGDGFRALRQTLGYGWSVVAAAVPEDAVPYFEEWMRSGDKDVAWVMKSNLGKHRMAGLRDRLLAATRP